MDRGDLHGAGWRVSKTCEREQEKCYCWGAANEGCREERRGGVGGVKRGHTHADQKTTVLSYAQRTDAAIYLSWEWEGKREDWLLPDVEAALTPRHPSLLSSLSGAAEDCQPVQTKHKIRVLAEQVCLQLCVTCFTTLQSLSRPTCTHSQNFLSRANTYMLTSRLAGRQAGRHTHTYTPPLPLLSVRRAVLLILVRAARGCILLLSSSSSNNNTGRVQRRAVTTRDQSAAAPTEGKPLSLVLLIHFPSFSHLNVTQWCWPSLSPFSPPTLFLLSSVGQWDSHGGHPHLQPCHFLPGVWTPGTAHASQWVSLSPYSPPPKKNL